MQQQVQPPALRWLQTVSNTLPTLFIYPKIPIRRILRLSFSKQAIRNSCNSYTKQAPKLKESIEQLLGQ
ncbi:hypothetical protein GCM10007879_11450 [Maritalea porphyrae]|uniref:Uncharacterized protein n=1 Tax=Maritalea porphyrae TaxID=880732 RepID=A0ABQ5URA2_9HYPH|nr:hypothetical protein GCM10007879_11450 [Maritalea porphyrae]